MSTTKKPRVLRNVIFLGLISLFTDLSTEMVYPLIPLYLTMVLGATPALVGIIEGIAESVASLLKVFSGYVSDRFQKKKLLAFIGYAPGILYKLALLIAGTWAGVLAARVIDRIGKGIRTAPRDVLVSESTDKNNMGRAFGIHKALDMLGTALGVLIAYLILLNMSNGIDYKLLFGLSLIPAALGLALFSFVKEKKLPRPTKKREAFWKNFGKISGQLRLYLLVSLLFTLGNSSNAFILLKAYAVGFDTISVILLYLIYSAIASILSIPLGRLSDRIGRKKLLVSGYSTFTLCYLCFGFAPNQGVMIAAFVLYGAYTALITGVERAYIVEISPPELKGTMLGLQATVVGIALLPASIIAGILWDTFNATVPFVFGAALSLVAALLLLFLMRNNARVSDTQVS
ncbi:MAG: MFS transporter [Coriobacteriales bacterium]|jgi:MFS family permease|nr:MFS transporter [Coriobacteriales bacterium]